MCAALRGRAKLSFLVPRSQLVGLCVSKFVMFHPALILIALGQTAPPAQPAQNPQNPQTPPAQAGGQTTPVTPATVPVQPSSGQAPQTPAAQSAAPQAPATPQTATTTTTATMPVAMFVKAMAVPELSRLALSPKIDGKIEGEEWDPFSTADGVDSFFQWEPDKLHFAAAHVPTGQDLVISIDGHGDGWLVGKDNLEVRVHWNNNVPEVTERILDNTPVSGPMWVDAPNFKSSTTIAGSADDKGHTVELTITDPATGLLPERSEHTIGLRMDAIAESTAPGDPLYPRIVTPVRLTMARGNSLPSGLTWRPEVPQRSVVPGETSKIRLTFKGNDELNLKRVDMRTQGLAQNDTMSSGVPFPDFDKKGRAFVDYKTRVTSEAALGYRVMKATVTDSQGKSAVLETSFEIAPLVSFDFHEKNVATSTEPQLIKFVAYIRSHTSRRVDGVFRVQAPEGWKIKSGNEQSFLIYDSRGAKRQVFEIVVPGGYKGTAPIKLIADFAGQHTEETEYITVG
jgi:hypothetical protein